VPPEGNECRSPSGTATADVSQDGRGSINDSQNVHRPPTRHEITHTSHACRRDGAVGEPGVADGPFGPAGLVYRVRKLQVWVRSVLFDRSRMARAPPTTRAVYRVFGASEARGLRIHRLLAPRVMSADTVRPLALFVSRKVDRWTPRTGSLNRATTLLLRDTADENGAGDLTSTLGRVRSTALPITLIVLVPVASTIETLAVEARPMVGR